MLSQAIETCPQYNLRHIFHGFPYHVLPIRPHTASTKSPTHAWPMNITINLCADIIKPYMTQTQYPWKKLSLQESLPFQSYKSFLYIKLLYFPPPYFLIRLSLQCHQQSLSLFHFGLWSTIKVGSVISS